MKNTEKQTEWTIMLGGREQTVQVTRKAVRQLRMSVADDGRISLSAPLCMPEREIHCFVEQHTGWLEKTFAKQEKRSLPPDAETLAEGSFVRYMGREYTVHRTRSVKDTVEPGTDGVLRIGCRWPMDDAAVRRAVDSWWRARAYACFEQAVDRYLPAFGGRVAKPTITVKKLTSKWGSCATQRAHINLNYYLLRAPEMCIDYVVVHELAHFLELAHDARFYKIVGSILPGWKDCRAALGLERLR